MKVHLLITLSIALFTISGIAPALTPPDGPYLGQTPPGLTAEKFAPDLVSLPNRRDVKVVFSPDGNECFVGTVQSSTFTFLYTKQENGHWTEFAPANFLGAADKREPFISPSGQKLFFTRNADIYVSAKDGNDWTSPSKLPSPVSTSAEEWHPTTTADGTLYFCSSRNSPVGYYNIYRSELENGQYLHVEQLDAVINSQYGAWDPFIAPNEAYMIFSTERPDGFGKVDQHISYFKDDGTWSYPVNLGSAINSSGIDYGSYIGYDGRYYLFSRPEGWGPNIEADIYWVDASAIFPVYDFTRDGEIDYDDLDVIAGDWLTEESSTDIAPAEEPDGVVNLIDLALFSQYWLNVSF